MRYSKLLVTTYLPDTVMEMETWQVLIQSSLDRRGLRARVTQGVRGGMFHVYVRAKSVRDVEKIRNALPAIERERGI